MQFANDNILYKALLPGYKRKCFLAKYVVGFRSKKLAREEVHLFIRDIQSSSNWELISSSATHHQKVRLFSYLLFASPSFASSWRRMLYVCFVVQFIV
jgi:hypothetical protein